MYISNYISNLNLYVKNESQDFFEKTGNILAYPILVIAGRTYKVTNHTNKFEELPEIKTLYKVFLAFLLLLTSPISIPCVLIGRLAHKYSKTYQSTFHNHQNQIIQDQYENQPLDKPPEPLTKPLPDNEISLPPQGYEWVKEDEDAKKFLDAAPESSIILALARSAVGRRSPMGGFEQKLTVEFLFNHASAEQLKIIALGVANNRGKLRKIFQLLFQEINQERSMFDGEKWVPRKGVTDVEEWKNKISNIVKVLSYAQIMDMIAIKFDPKSFLGYQGDCYALSYIPLEGFIRWGKDISLPDEFVEQCKKLLRYSAHVKKEAEKERAQGKILCID